MELEGWREGKRGKKRETFSLFEHASLSSKFSYIN